MKSRRPISRTLLAVVVVGTTPIAAATAPSPINNLTDRMDLTAQDRGMIRRYAEYWCDQLTSANQQVHTARGRLVEPLRTLRVGRVFRHEYSRAALPRLKEIIKAENPLLATNAMQVVAFLGTERALEAIVSHCDTGDEPRFNVRLWSAKAFVIAVGQGTLAENEINRALRRLGHAAAREENWLVLRRQFEGIASVNGPVSREVQLSVLRAANDRMKSDQAGPSELMRAVYPALKRVRDEYLRLAKADQKAFGPELCPVLCDVCSIARAHWDNAQNDPVAKKTYGGAVQISESMLQLIDPEVRPAQRTPRTQLGRAWKDRDEPRFEEDHLKWKDVLDGPPYKNP